MYHDEVSQRRKQWEKRLGAEWRYQYLQPAPEGWDEVAGHNRDGAVDRLEHQQEDRTQRGAAWPRPREGGERRAADDSRQEVAAEQLPGGLQGRREFRGADEIETVVVLWP
jgi:hypothetical protein